ncbi:hypothetical protein SY2F82_11910 [Streptomyces sp. Y2F8-2]|uniref:MFS transporter n=1 Tax=Streptomyces sp. Y2F8-2 TaxID=2759675 RepID=UPI001907CD2C|nr:MFS transporter [Streptomyces sp. Y2F8-2]GHJ99393.1 hypothetical protein SY2F82_11910 [Streptomyces sp. Y2F8-2]
MGTALALMVFASLSDRVGRRPLLAAAVLAAATSTALFLLAHDVGTLLAARFLCGLGTGVFTATGTAALGELAGVERTRLVSTVSTAANMGGLGLGTIVAGLFAQYGANPTHLVFWAYLAGLVPAFVAVIVTPETVTSRQRSLRRPSRAHSAARPPPSPERPPHRVARWPAPSMTGSEWIPRASQ